MGLPNTTIYRREVYKRTSSAITIANNEADKTETTVDQYGDINDHRPSLKNKAANNDTTHQEATAYHNGDTSTNEPSTITS